MSVELSKHTVYIKNTDSPNLIEHKIIEISESIRTDEKFSLEVVLGGGAYTLNSPITLDSDLHPGLKNMQIEICSDEGAAATITSLKEIDLKALTKISENIYKCQFEADSDGKYPVFRELYSDGRKLEIAKSDIFIHPFGLPNASDYSDPVNERCLFILSQTAEKLLAYAESYPAEINMYLEWEWCNAKIGSIDVNDVREDNGEKYYRLTLHGNDHTNFIKNQHSCIDICNRQFFISNHPAFLTPDTYCYDSQSGVLYYYLPNGENINSKSLSYPTLEQLFVFGGLNNVTLRGLTFTGVGSKLICENMYYACQSNAEKRFGLLKHAAIVTRDMKDFTVQDCKFLDLGGNGILMTDSSTRVRIRDSKFYRISMSAIVIGNRTTAWENPKNRNFDIQIINNRLHTIGFEYPAAGGIYISMIDGLKILNNTIEKTAYSGITVGWGWSQVHYSLGEKVNIRDAEIAYNKIIDFMQILRDGAAIYVLGANCTREHSGQFNFMHDNYAEREMYKDHSKRGYYMDGSSSNWETFNNVIFGVRLPIFSQFHVESQYTYHNYIHDIYTDFPIDHGNHAPWRDTIVGDCYYVEDGKEALLNKYPNAQKIIDASGSNLEF